MYVGENAYRQKRVATECKEIIVDTDLFDLQHLCPNAGQRFLERRSWRDEGSRIAALIRETELRAKPTRFTLPVGPFGSSADDENLARDLEVGEAPGGEPTNGVRRRHSVGPQHDGRRNVLAKGSVGDGKGYGLCNSWMVQQHFVDFLGSDFFAAAIDNLACAAHKKEVPVVVEVTEISCLEPIAGKRGLGRLRIAFVAHRDASAPDDDLTGPAARQQSPSFVHDRDIQDSRQPDRTRLALVRRQRIACNGRGSDFGHPVRFDHAELSKVSLEFGEDARRQRS